MRCNRSMAVGFAILSSFAVSQTLLAQRGRGGGPTTGTGRTGVPSGSRADRDIGDMGSTAPAMKRLEDNAAVASRIQPLLPPGANLHSAASGFRNEGEFVAALHASHTLGIPFDQLKRQMTEGSGKSLGSAIRTLRPDLGKKAVNESVKAAERTAHEDLREGRPGRTESGIATEIHSKPGLSTRLAPLLPAGMTVEQASQGFRNTGQFVAALHVARNLNIPFSDLRARMIAGGEPLGEAIHQLRPEMRAADIEASVSDAGSTARSDLQTGQVAGTPPAVRQ